MAESIEELSYEMTGSALAEQERALSGLRTCASTILGAASVAGSFLGARAIHGALDAWSVLALLSFATCFGSAIWVLWPHYAVFAFRGRAMLRDGDYKRVPDLPDAYRQAGSWMEAHMDINAQTISDLSTWLALSCVALAAEVILWTIGLVG
ncbi:MAG: hypothetical protein ACYDHN_16930 [Solirubrobacteraceae bacterium]